jgi:uncharacterized tellurite resistance protein B-like protein
MGSLDSTAGQDSKPEDRDAAIRMATAVLMIDVARADHVFDEEEFDRILNLIEQHFDLTAQQAAELVNVANDRAEEIVSVYEFTQLLKQHLDDREKASVISLLWRIAYADGRLSKFEDSLVLKISDLLYVSRGLVMRLKHDAQVAAES